MEEYVSVEVLQSNILHELLAQRFPFLLVDRVRIEEPGRRVVGVKRISSGEWWCDQHAPSPVIMPYSLVIEGLAQTAAALLRDLTENGPGVIAYFMGANRVRLRLPARPGDQLELAVTLQQWRRGICRTRGVATVDGALVASAVLSIIVRRTP
jgi:3-hydroxyacyl-[acyl-carrier-protein] dehydratase